MKRNPLYSQLGFNAAFFVARNFSRNACLKIAHWVGRISYSLNADAKTALRTNLKKVIGTNGSSLDTLCKQNVSNFSQMLADYFYSMGIPAGEIPNLLQGWEGIEHIEAALQKGKGAILVTAHLGNWELGGALLALQKFPMNIVTLEEPTTELTKLRDQYRQRLGIKTIAVGADRFAFVDVIAALRRNEVVAMLVDRPYANSGIPVHLFGTETEFSTAPALLWQHTQAPIIPAFVLKMKDGRYLSFAQKEIEMAAQENPRVAMQANTQRIADVFQDVIWQHPEQWYNYVPLFKK